jgi:hypothetical protein
MLPLRPARPSALPSVAETVNALLAALQQLDAVEATT